MDSVKKPEFLMYIHTNLTNYPSIKKSMLRTRIHFNRKGVKWLFQEYDENTAIEILARAISHEYIHRAIWYALKDVDGTEAYNFLFGQDFKSLTEKSERIIEKMGFGREWVFGIKPGKAIKCG